MPCTQALVLLAQEPALRDMAKAALHNWVRACGHQLRVLLDPHFVSDPRRDAAAVLKAAAERIAAARRGRDKPAGSATAGNPSQVLLVPALHSPWYLREPLSGATFVWLYHGHTLICG